MYSCLFAALHVTFGWHVAMKLGLGQPITCFPISVKIEFAIDPVKHIKINFKAGPIHAGICNFLPELQQKIPIVLQVEKFLARITKYSTRAKNPKPPRKEAEIRTLVDTVSGRIGYFKLRSSQKKPLWEVAWEAIRLPLDRMKSVMTATAQMMIPLVMRVSIFLLVCELHSGIRLLRNVSLSKKGKKFGQIWQLKWRNSRFSPF